MKIVERTKQRSIEKNIRKYSLHLTYRPVNCIKHKNLRTNCSLMMQDLNSVEGYDSSDRWNYDGIPSPGPNYCCPSNFYRRYSLYQFRCFLVVYSSFASISLWHFETTPANKTKEKSEKLIFVRQILTYRYYVCILVCTSR